MKFIRIGFLTACFSILAFGQAVQNPLIGETEKVFSLAEGNDEVRGLAWDDIRLHCGHQSARGDGRPEGGGRR
jgi:hypothetical protein